MSPARLPPMLPVHPGSTPVTREKAGVIAMEFASGGRMRVSGSVHTLVATAKLNDVGRTLGSPMFWHAYRITRRTDRRPWNWQAERSAAARSTASEYKRGSLSTRPGAPQTAFIASELGLRQEVRFDGRAFVVHTLEG
jgi:hypothetical protein